MATQTLYPKSDGVKRPFRLWDAKAKKAMPWRNYKHRRNAHLGALVEARWSKVGTCIEVYDATNGKLCGQYTRRLHTIDFQGD